jgi:hypothetical protein
LGCALWLIVVLLVLLALELLFGGFQLGTRAGGSVVPHTPSVYVATS